MSSERNESLMQPGFAKDLFSTTRKATLELCAPLERDDYMVQATPDTSPPKWHLGHTTWFFDNFILKPFRKEYQPYDPAYSFIFNSYYETVGEFVPKPSRAVISRPSLEKVLGYREAVNHEIMSLIETSSGSDLEEILKRVTLGVNHEQQHQELLLMDIKRNFYASPSRPVYSDAGITEGESAPLQWLSFPESVEEIGHEGPGFAFDNETPRHRELIHGFSIASRPATNGEYIEFIEDGGYRRPELWLSGGWEWRLREKVDLPLYWEKEGSTYRYFTLGGMDEVNPEEPVSHVSYYEADAFARWSGNRLPTEFQWEKAAVAMDSAEPGNYLERGAFAPLPWKAGSNGLSGLGNLWEWTSSAYLPYPGFRPLPGSLGEYNGKFMSDQMVLKGSSYATPRSHYRTTYRNFYHPDSRWQFSGIRLGKDDFNE